MSIKKRQLLFLFTIAAFFIGGNNTLLFGQVGGIKLPSIDNNTTNSTTGNKAAGNKGIIDDSTKIVYGPTTTRYFFEGDILNNRDSTRFTVDTSLNNFQRWTFLDSRWETYADLGNFGTSVRPLYYEMRNELGIQLGYRSYSLYGFQPDEVRYFDTRSPYTDMYYMIGGSGRNFLKFGFTQNIKPNWNMGFRLQRFNSTKQYGSYSGVVSAANLASNWSFLLHTSYFSKDKKYLMLAHWRNKAHQVKEQGGIVASDSLGGSISSYEYDGAAHLDDDAYSRESQNSIRVYQQYRMNESFRVYHQLDLTRQKNYYVDDTPLTGLQSGLYPKPAGDTVNINQRTGYTLIDNAIGIKGVYRGFNYRLYGKQRYHALNTNYLVNDSTSSNYRTRKFENIVGLRLNQYLKDSSYHFSAVGELSTLHGDLLLRGDLDMKWVTAGIQLQSVSPDILQERYLNQYYSWENRNFAPVNTLSLFGSLPLVTRKVSIIPEVQWHTIQDYIYYNAEAKPAQYGQSFSLLRVGSTFKFDLNRWVFQGRGYYTVNTNSDYLRIPPLFLTGQVTFDFVYAKVLYIQLGLAATYRQSYLADAYMPMTQQFHLQNSLPTNNYAVVDVFGNFRIRQARILLQVSHVNQGVLGGTSNYFTTPTYLGLKRSFTIGVSWPLFD